MSAGTGDAAGASEEDAAAGNSGLRECQVEAITGLEHSLAENRPRSLIQMATGSSKTCKVLCHNLCVLVQAMHELEIEPTF